jgi:RHS repeat-associated protein
LACFRHEAGTAAAPDHSADPNQYDANNRLEVSTGPEPVRPMTLEWDRTGRLSKTTNTLTGAATAYVYDGHGRRVEKAEPAETTIYHHDAAGQVIAETGPDGAKRHDYFYLGNKLIAVDSCATGNSPTCAEWYHTDALGSVAARSNAAGTVVARLDYQPWGEQWLVQGDGGDRQYNGRVFDPGTGFHDYGARMYWPEMGRFISADSVMGEPASPASLRSRIL